MIRAQAMAEIAGLANPECAEVNVTPSFLADKLAESMEICNGHALPTEGTLYWVDWIMHRARWGR